MQTVKIIFSAVIKNIEIRFQTISLGGIYPDIEIECKDDEGLHIFKIKKGVQHTQSSMLDPVVKEASDQIENFWMMLEHILNKPIHPSEKIPIQHSNESITPYVSTKISGTTLTMGSASAVMILTENWLSFNKNKFFEKYDFDLLKRLNFAKRLADPTSKYLSLYSLVSSIAGDDQRKIDNLILEIDPTIQRTLSPHKIRGQEIIETTFTRLRNELAHHREDASIFTTHHEIKLNIDRFQYIVDSIINKKLSPKAS